MSDIKHSLSPRPHRSWGAARVGVIIGMVAAIVAAWGIISRVRAENRLEAETQAQNVLPVNITHPRADGNVEDLVLPGDVRAWADAPIYARTSGYLKRWLVDIGTPVTNLGPMTCPLARNFAAWARYAVKPAARQYFGTEVVKIETYGTYSCRNIYGGRSGRLSQHASSNAIDVAGFVLADGRRIMLDGGWKGDKASQDFLRALHKSACRRFGTVLSPDYNAAHYNHFHLDMSGNGYCR